MQKERAAPVAASAEILIHAPVEMVWAVHVDLAGWPDWHPEISRMDLRGPLSRGTEFRWKAGGASITSVLDEVDPRLRIAWRGRAVGLRAAHTWELEPDGDSTRVRTAEAFEGLLAKLFPGMMRRMLDRTLGVWLEALKAESEQRARKAPAGQIDYDGEPIG